jgi:tRNA (guanine-N7-)-methyltransferase
MYNCTLHKASENIYAENNISRELEIKTYYESLDIAQSSRVHYLCFSLPNEIEGKEKDEELKQILHEQHE